MARQRSVRHYADLYHHSKYGLPCGGRTGKWRIQWSGRLADLPPVTANTTVTASFAVNVYTVTRNQVLTAP